MSKSIRPILLMAMLLATSALAAPTQVDITGINKLVKEGPNAIEWVVGPLSRAVPPGAHADIVALKDTLEDEEAQGPAANPDACKLGIKLCDLLLATMTDRETTIAKVQANDKSDIDAATQSFFDQSVNKAWTGRANQSRSDAESIYEQFRKVARPTLAALHGQSLATAQNAGGEQILTQQPPAPAQEGSPSKPVVFSAGGGGPGDFQIISATYGADKKKRDVSNQIRRHIADNELHMTEADWSFGPDPAPGKHKSLTIVYYANGVEKTYKSDSAGEITLP